MPTHLRPALLRRSLTSLRQQTFQDFEVIVVADALDRDTAIVAADLLGPKDTFLKRTGAPGPALSRNAGLDQAKGQWIVFLDDDDSFEPHHLQALHQRASQGDAPHVLFTDCEIVTEDRTQADIQPLSKQRAALTQQNVDALWVKNFIPNLALAYRRSLIDDCRFDPHLDSQEDWDFLLAVCSRAMPAPVQGGGPVMHKDYINPGLRRGQQEKSNNTFVVLDFLHIYRRWPAPTPEIRLMRKNLMQSVGLDLPVEWF